MNTHSTAPAPKSATPGRTNDQREPVAFPGNCPPWCLNQHHQAYDEGCTYEASAEHTGADASYQLDQIRSAYDDRLTRDPHDGSWSLRLAAAPAVVAYGDPHVRLKTYWVEQESGSSARVTLDLTSGEARVLARRLTAYADRVDLEELQ